MEVTLPLPQDQNLMCDFHTDDQLYNTKFFKLIRKNKSPKIYHTFLNSVISRINNLKNIS